MPLKLTALEAFFTINYFIFIQQLNFWRILSTFGQYFYKIVKLTGHLMTSHPPDSNADGSSLQGRVARSGVFPSRELEDPLPSQRPFTGAVGPDGYAIRWCGRRVQLEWTQPCGGAVRLHQSHGYGHGPRPWQSMERQLHWHHSHCQTRCGSNEQLRV